MERKKRPTKAPALYIAVALKRVAKGPMKWHEVTRPVSRAEAITTIRTEWKAGNLARLQPAKMAAAA